MYRQHLPSKYLAKLPEATGLRRLFSGLFLLRKKFRKWNIKRKHTEFRYTELYDARPFFRTLRRGKNSHCRICMVHFGKEDQNDFQNNCMECFNEIICKDCHGKKFGVRV